MTQPILVLGNSEAPNRFAGYLREILATEGVVAWEFRDLAMGPVELAGYDLVILENAPVTAEWRARLEMYVRDGGRLLASRPPLELAGLFGLKPKKGVVKMCAELYATFNTAHPLATQIGVENLQFHGVADLYEPVGAEPLAWLGGQLGVRTNFPAVTLHEPGKGLAAAFTFDLALCTVLFHQGRRINASDGPDSDPDADGAFKPNDLFYKFLDERLKTIPQADLYADLFLRLIQHLSRRPLPRLWHYPNAAPSVAFLDGDSDSMTSEDMEKVIHIIESVQGRYTIYLMPDHYGAIAPERMKALRQAGHDAGPHPFAGRKPQAEESAKEIAQEVAGFRAHYGFDPKANRGHSVIWMGWVAHARELLRNGIRLDTNFCCGAGFQYGYLNGSGLPVRFMDEDGQIVDVYEQATISTDDGWRNEKCLMPAMTKDECIALSRQQIDEAADRWHAVYHPYFHPTGTREGTLDTAPWIEAVAAHVAARGVPFVNGREWLAFNDARRATKINGARWDSASGELQFTVTSTHGFAGLTLLLPEEFGGKYAKTDLTCKPVTLEGKRQLAVVLDLKAGQELPVRVAYQ